MTGTDWAGPGFTGPPTAPDPLPEEHYHWATDGRPGARIYPPCRCDTPSLAHRPGTVQGPSQLRTALRKILSDSGMLTLAQVERHFAMRGRAVAGSARRELIDELAAMRDDGEVRFEGPRYVWAGKA